MITRLFLICALSLAVVPASADDAAQANKLLVEAVKRIQAAGTKQTPSEQIPLLEEALDKLNEIVEQHPTNDLAVKLITGQQIGNISLTELADEIKNLKRQAAHDDAMAARSACLESLDINDSKCSMWLPDIVRVHLRNGNIDSALDTATAVAPGYARDNMLFEISRKQAQAGHVKKALVTAERIETQGVRDTAFHEISVNQAAVVGQHMQKGSLTDALAMANTIRSIQVRDAALQDIVTAQVRAGAIQEALAAAGFIEAPRRRQSALRAIASVQIRVANQHLYAGNLQDALRTAAQIPDALARDQVFAAVATNQLAAEQFAGAVRTAQGIQDPSARDPVLARVAVAQLQQGNAQAASTAKLIQTAGIRDQVLQEFVRIHVQDGNLESALTFAKTIGNIDTRDGRLNTIAQKHIEAGNLEPALSIAKLMRTGMRDQVLESMVRAYTRNKELGNALALTELINNDNTRQTRFYYIAQAHLQAGELQAAASIAQLMQPGNLRDQILNAIGQSR